MGRISTLFQTIKDLNKDRWVRKYNPHQRFFVDVDWYNTEEDYLNALRDDWKSEADPFDECDHYVDVTKYDNFEDYEKAVNICLEHLEWIEEVSRYGDFDIDPQNYKNEDTYLDALTKRIKEKYDPENEFYCIDPLDYDSPYEYQYEIDERIHWLELYDPNHQYPVDPSEFKCEGGYVEAVNEWKDYVARLDAELDEEDLKSDDMDDYRNEALKQMSRKRPNSVEYHLDNIVEVHQEENVSEDDKKSWEDKHNFYNSFSSVDPTQYDRELDYLDDLRKQWKEYYDPTEMYDVDPSDYDNEEEYMEAIKQYIKSKYK